MVIILAIILRSKHASVYFNIAYDCILSAAYICDEDEEYQPSGSVCRPTCSDPLADATCNQADGEVCVCKDNKVLDDNGVCVDAISCGCVMDGISHQVCS